MDPEERGKMLDTIWTEIRQLVLNDGPATEHIDEMIAELPGFPMQDREALIAQVIAFHCAQITRIAEGPMCGAPPAIVFAHWARIEMNVAMGGEES
jgi:hypothetical protein